MAKKNKTMWVLLLAGGAAALWYFTSNNAATAAPSLPGSSTSAPTAAEVAAARQFVTNWAVAHNDGRWVSAAQSMTDADVLPMAYLLQTYFTPDGPGQLGAGAMADQYGNTLPDGYEWLYLTKKYGVS